MRDTGIFFLDEIELLVLHVDTMGHNGAVVQETVVGIDGGVVDRLGEERHGETNLIHVLTEMGLDRQLVLLGQLAQLRQEVRGAGDGEARGDDGSDQGLVVNLGVDILDILDEGTGVTDRGLGGFDQEIGRVLVHVDLADVGTLTLLLDDLDELLAGLEVDGGVPAGRGGAVAERAGDGLVVKAAGVVLVGEAGLGGEGVGVEPLEQRQIVSVSTESVLGSMLLR